MEAIEIRTAVPGDKEAVEAVIRSCDLSVDGIFAPGTLYLVGCINAEIIGAIGLEGYGGPACLLRSLAVLPEYRQRGIGSELMNSAHDAARIAGARQSSTFSPLELAPTTSGLDTARHPSMRWLAAFPTRLRYATTSATIASPPKLPGAGTSDAAKPALTTKSERLSP